MDDKVTLSEACEELDSYWTPKTVAAYNDSKVQVVKVLGEYVWHQHDATDDLFYVLEGEVTVQLRNQEDVELAAGDLYVVPKGTQHCLLAFREARLLLIEHLGDAESNAGPRVLEAMFPW